MTSKILRVGLLLAMVLLTGCTTKKPEWPSYVIESMWIPKGAIVSGKDYNGWYKIAYTVKVCYPAEAIINDMVEVMNAKGWKRLSCDPVNPSIALKLNHAIEPKGGWSHGLDPDMDEIYDWREFWEDDKHNIVHYVLKYKLKKNEPIENACTLSGYSSYISGERLRSLLNTLKEMPVAPPSGK